MGIEVDIRTSTLQHGQGKAWDAMMWSWSGSTTANKLVDRAVRDTTTRRDKEALMLGLRLWTRGWDGMKCCVLSRMPADSSSRTLCVIMHAVRPSSLLNQPTYAARLVVNFASESFVPAPRLYTLVVLSAIGIPTRRTEVHFVFREDRQQHQSICRRSPQAS